MGGVNAVQIKIVDSLYHAMLVGCFGGLPAFLCLHGFGSGVFLGGTGVCTVSGRMPVGASLGCWIAIRHCQSCGMGYVY